MNLSHKFIFDSVVVYANYLKRIEPKGVKKLVALLKIFDMNKRKHAELSKFFFNKK